MDQARMKDLLSGGNASSAVESVINKATGNEVVTAVETNEAPAIPDELRPQAGQDAAKVSVEVEYRRSLAYNSGSVKIWLSTPCAAGAEIRVATILADQADTLAREHIASKSQPMLRQFAESR